MTITVIAFDAARRLRVQWSSPTDRRVVVAPSTVFAANVSSTNEGWSAVRVAAITGKYSSIHHLLSPAWQRKDHARSAQATPQ